MIALESLSEEGKEWKLKYIKYFLYFLSEKDWPYSKAKGKVIVKGSGYQVYTSFWGSHKCDRNLRILLELYIYLSLFSLIIPYASPILYPPMFQRHAHFTEVLFLFSATSTHSLEYVIIQMWPLGTKEVSNSCRSQKQVRGQWM